ncbi:ComF family protein [Candidatus Electronema sp. PJ]|uniref:ComF family protein n=1 Tax=Candidatus Electronema sp. PJ TaxID=3401572 RepID=UPI003AA920AE
MQTALHALLEAVSALLFPARCLGCEKQLGLCRPPLLCKDCQAKLCVIVSPLCSCCGLPFASGADRLCLTCQQQPFAFNQARSLFVYQEPVSSLLLQLKFGNSLAGLSTLAALVEPADLATVFHAPDLLVPVPLHLSRLRWRGFNQSLLLAKTCFPVWQKKIQPDLLQRHRVTVPQTQLNGAERRCNLLGAFSLRDPQAVKGRRVLLVDDVFTTGSTLRECAEVLAAAGAAGIEAFTLARTVH